MFIPLDLGRRDIRRWGLLCRRRASLMETAELRGFLATGAAEAENGAPHVGKFRQHSGDSHRRRYLAELCAESYNSLMAQMNISIPEKLKGWAESRVAEGRYSSTSDYVRDLVRRDQEFEEARRRLQAAINEGLASGISERDPFQYLDQLR